MIVTIQKVPPYTERTMLELADGGAEQASRGGSASTLRRR
jgi:hypothetical protein